MSSFLEKTSRWMSHGTWSLQFTGDQHAQSGVVGKRRAGLAGLLDNERKREKAFWVKRPKHFNFNY